MIYFIYFIIFNLLAILNVHQFHKCSSSIFTCLFILFIIFIHSPIHSFDCIIWLHHLIDYFLIIINFFSDLISVPPNKPVIMDQNGEPQQSVISSYNEGDRLKLICEVEGGNPSPNVTWWKGDSLIDDSFEVTGPNTLKNELEIPSLQRGDLMTVFSCQASNNNISPPSSTAVTIDLNCK